MSGFELNKIAAAILLASLIITLTSFVVDKIYDPGAVSKTRGYQVKVESDNHAGDKQNIGQIMADNSAVNLDIPALMKQASTELGAVIFKKCAACHTLDKSGINRIGPNLWNVVNRHKGIEPNYTYSQALLAKGGEWDYENLFHFLRKPSSFIPGTKMTFVGLDKPQDIANVITYLLENSDKK